ncbi:MAG: CxxxxCH/CxxCH domain-containing protein [Actinomycetales bacterium]|nr:CxxxxCH/CxxCH domain-containing protein [Actinomycetales bacterium]
MSAAVVQAVPARRRRSVSASGQTNSSRCSAIQCHQSGSAAFPPKADVGAGRETS